MSPTRKPRIGRGLNLSRSRLRRWLILVPGGTLLFLLLLAFLHPYAFRTTLSYATRPLWDTLIYPSAPIINLASAELFSSQSPDYICRIHHSTPRTKPVQLWDAIIFSHELDMLEIHLAELYDDVDQFIILESTVTYSGQPKSLHYKENAQRYARFSDKIHYATFEGSDTAGFSFRPGDFAIETQQRGYMTDIINDLYRTSGAKPEEVLVLVADVDEIPYDHTLRLVKSCSLPPVLHLQLIPYVYSFEWVSGDLDSWHIQIHTWDPHSSYYKHSSKSTEDYITSAGVHCSFCFAKISEFQWKMKAYSHNDRLGDHPKALLRPERLQKAVCEGENIFGMLPEAYTWWDLVTRWKGHQARRQTAVSTTVKKSQG
jgi:beta-1,4-mannosyl-glycoprotein beta-1,4-N-acetylglucosaminyltransferase